MTQRKKKQADSRDCLITFDRAAELCLSAGFANLNKKWWTYHAVRGDIPAVPGMVTYVRVGDVEAMLEKQRNAQPGRIKTDVAEQGQLQLAS